MKAPTCDAIYGREMFATWYKLLAMLDSGLDLRPVITHRIDAADFAQGFELLQEGRAGKVVMRW